MALLGRFGVRDQPFEIGVVVTETEFLVDAHGRAVLPPHVQGDHLDVLGEQALAEVTGAGRREAQATVVGVRDDVTEYRELALGADRMNAGDADQLAVLYDAAVVP